MFNSSVSELKSKEVLDIFEDSMNEDLNTPKMLGSLFKLINESDTLNEQKLSELKSSIKFVFKHFFSNVYVQRHRRPSGNAIFKIIVLHGFLKVYQ